ncbi:MAG TPA: hypothetical protein VF952_02655 [Chloroflexia bacterium]|jgi:hypothetical protein
MSSWQTVLVILLSVVAVIILVTAISRGLKRSWLELVSASLLLVLIFSFVLSPDEWFGGLKSKNSERILQLHVQMSDLANNSIVVQPNEYVSLTVGEHNQAGTTEYNDLHVAKVLDKDSKDAAYSSALPNSIVLRIPEKYASPLRVALKNKDNVPIYLYGQGPATVTRTSTSTAVPTSTGTPPSATSTPTTTAISTPIPAELATFSLPIEKIEADLLELRKHQSEEIAVILVVAQKDQDTVTHRGYAFDATLVSFLNAGNQSLSPEDISKAATVLIALKRGDKDVQTAQFAARLHDATAIHLLPAGPIPTVTTVPSPVATQTP